VKQTGRIALRFAAWRAEMKRRLIPAGTIAVFAARSVSQWQR
jgi:hypothetical protein